ncbi:hypothetical protein ACPF04_06195 [Campylobacter sp. MOP51]|uniref:hypothetical protein n=1 Tax=Campylobacter canis TaxID=3378588 RepID=UPI003C64D8E1
MNKLNKKILFLTLVTAYLWLPATASDFIRDAQKFGKTINPQTQALSLEDSIKAYNDKKFELAGDSFLLMFLKGDFQGVGYLGDIFARGLGVDPDCKKAAYFLFAGVSSNICHAYDVLISLMDEDICFSRQQRDKYLIKQKECRRK